MTYYASLSRGDWLALADRFYAQLDRSMAILGPAEWGRRTPYLGWRARDVLAHMTSAIPVNFRQVLDRAAAGNPAAPPEFDTFTRNARELARRRLPVDGNRQIARRLTAAFWHFWERTAMTAVNIARG